MNIAHYHLPGLFEFYELYKIFLPLYREHRDWFYDWCNIGSIYGAPSDCLWGGGRAAFSDADVDDVFKLVNEFGISARLTFSNSLLQEEHLSDRKCNELCKKFSKTGVKSGVIVHSDLLVNYLKSKYQQLYLVSSTTKVLTDFDDLQAELNSPDFAYVVPDFRLNKAFDRLPSLPQDKKDKVEIVANALELPYFYLATKPLKRGFKKAIKLLQEKEENIAAVGDQIFTDVIGANRCHLYSILVKPLGKKDLLVTRIKRPLENFIINRYKRKMKNSN